MGRPHWLLALSPMAVVVPLAPPSAAQVRSDCPGGIAPQGVVVAVGGDVTARSQAGDPFDISVGHPSVRLTGSRPAAARVSSSAWRARTRRPARPTTR